MGCRASRLNENAVITIPIKRETDAKPTAENVVQNNEEVSEYSLRECSIIPVQPDNARRRASDPSIFGLLQEI